MLIDERFSANDQRADLHDHVALIIEKVLDGFRVSFLGCFVGSVWV
jgi:hypothetical protein